MILLGNARDLIALHTGAPSKKISVKGFGRGGQQQQHQPGWGGKGTLPYASVYGKV